MDDDFVTGPIAISRPNRDECGGFVPKQRRKRDGSAPHPHFAITSMERRTRTQSDLVGHLENQLRDAQACADRAEQQQRVKEVAEANARADTAHAEYYKAVDSFDSIAKCALTTMCKRRIED